MMKKRTAIAIRYGYGLVILVLVLAALPAIRHPWWHTDTPAIPACMDNLSQIQFAKQQWAAANHKTNGAPVVVAEVNQYLKRGKTPLCPNKGAYTYNPIGVDPECSCPFGRLVAAGAGKMNKGMPTRPAD